MILLVDDQAFVAEAIRRMLADEADIDFHFCADPSQALQRALELHPTLILQDLVMPGVDGLMLVKFYRASSDLRSVPVIVLSSKEQPLDKSAAFGAGATDYLVKLPDRIELLARIRAHARSYQAQKERDAAYQALQELRQQLEASNARLRDLSTLDGLTGIANRRRFDEALVEEWRRAHRTKDVISAALIDVDHFKLYNDSCGHQQGDDCLRKVAATLASGAHRAGDVCARYGGEEFVVLMPATPIDGAFEVAERIRRSVEALAIPHPKSSVGPHITISVGVCSLSPQDLNGSAELVAKADVALYRSKHEGRNRVLRADQ